MRKFLHISRNSKNNWGGGGSPSSIILNIDKMGYQEFADSWGYHVVIPEDMKEEDVLLPVKRGNNRITIVERIFADGSRL